MNPKKHYSVFVEAITCLSAHVEVEATNQEEAQNLAVLKFDSLQCKSKYQDWNTSVLSEDGERVEWCKEAFQKDWRNPYRKRVPPAHKMKSNESINK